MDITVLIRTINRPTLNRSVDSALKEFDNVVVISDAIDVDTSQLPKNVTYLKTGQKFDSFGSAAINMGAYASKTDYVCLLDDDDEFVVGAGNIMRKAINEKPEIDIWIPGLKYSNGRTACTSGNGGVATGNIAVPTYKTKLFFTFPFTSRTNVSNNPHWIDADHVKTLHSCGCKVDWYGAVLIVIRPHLSGDYGQGHF